ncbi:hypothetical protein [Campylobacter concisus]|jgi:hypothetical protein|uniref:hypothetical protein n=1 Tax=Campylobacter concisus TaxID=199 RepID=UPI00122CE6D6|nr:hypothetical protein [Campylobacter concisus]
MKLYELFLGEKELGVFLKEPQKVIYCDGTSDGFELLCFNFDEWQALQEKLGITFTNDENDNFNKIMSSKFCKENDIEYIDQLAEGLGFGTLEKFDYERVEYVSDMEESYSYFIDELAKTAGKANFDWNMECNGLYQSNGHTDRWILCDKYNELEENDFDDELAKFHFDTEAIDEQFNIYTFGCQVQGYDIVSITKDNKTEIKLLVWSDGNTQTSYLEYRFEDIKTEWMRKYK